jgi:hypothetical protein
MKRKLQIALILLLISLLTLSGLAFQMTAPLLEVDEPPPPGERPDADEIAALIAQSGGTDGIMLLGILIFLISVVPMFLLKKDW